MVDLIKKTLSEYRNLDQIEYKSQIFDSPQKQERTAWIRKLVSKAGLIKRSEYGSNSAHYAWLLIQHSDDIFLQKLYLKLMRLQPHECNPVDMAKLWDRVLINQGYYQKFGTHFDTSNLPHSLKPLPIVHPKTVNKRRHHYGLSPIKVQRKQILSDHAITLTP